MRIAFYSTKPYEREFFANAELAQQHHIEFFTAQLDVETAQLAQDFTAVCGFVNDDFSAVVLQKLNDSGVSIIALRSAGYNHIDLKAAKALGMTVLRVPEYSPYAVAEHTLALILTLNRKTHRAFNRVRESNFSLNGLMGFDLHGKTVGIIGTGRIGSVFARIMQGLGCTLLAYDPVPNTLCRELGVRYVNFAELLTQSDIISLHCPLTEQSKHLIDTAAIAKMRKGVMLINTGRGALIDTPALIDGLKSGRLGAVGLDVYEEESELFFEDHSGEIIQDELFARLMTFPNVLITGHQGFFTDTAMLNITTSVLRNLTDIEQTGKCLDPICCLT